MAVRGTKTETPIDDSRVIGVQAMIKAAIEAGATRLTRAVELPAAGSYVAPTLLADVPDDTAIATQEIFGPEAGVFRFCEEREVLARANATEAGLAGYFWSQDVGRVWRMAERLEVGILGVNNALPTTRFAPMGGVKQSGLVREGGELGLEEFQDVRYLALGL